MKLFVACAALLAMPGTAMAAEFSVSGPPSGSVNESAGTATYEVVCGETDVMLSTFPNLGTLSVTVEPEAPSDDYGAPTETSHTCSALEPGFTFDIPITDDAIDEQDETFTVTVSGPLVPAGTVSESVETTIIDDNDPVASIAPVVLLEEGDSGTQDAALQVTLSSAPIKTTTVKYATEELSATPGTDYVETSDEVVFQAGQTTKTITVPVIGDTVFEEKPEGFFVNLTGTDNGILSPTARQGAVAIFDNDPRPIPALTIDRTVTVDEGNRGTVNTLFTVSLSFVPTEVAQVSWKTIDWTATEADYRPANGRLVFQPGQRTKTISVNVKGDKDDEPDEAFGVVLENPAGATLGNPDSGFGIITDDDGPTVGIGKPKVRKRALVTKLACPETATRCRGRFKAKSGRLKLGRARIDMQRGTTTKVHTRLSRKARRKLSKRARRAKVIVVARDASGAKQKTVRKVRLKRRR